MKVFCAAQALKESLTVGEVKSSLNAGILSAGAQIGQCIGISDGGDGFLDAVVESENVQIIPLTVAGPLGTPINSTLGLTPNHSAYIEMAKASGLTLVKQHLRDVWAATSAGTGQLVVHALEREANAITIGLGGSATNDGGIGFLAAMSDSFGFTSYRRPLTPRDLEIAYDIPLKSLVSKFATVTLRACTDVTNPLLGPTGCATVFAPQKGASQETVIELDKMMSAWAEHVEKSLHVSLRHAPGSGAAGGMGFALAALNATLEPGAAMFLHRTQFLHSLKAGDITLTTEGRFDRSTMMGKAPWIIATAARERGAIPYILCGSFDGTAAESAESHGIHIRSFGENIPVHRRKEDSPAALFALTKKILDAHYDNR